MEGDFFLAAAHRLRGPLNVIAGWAGVLRAGNATPAVLEQAVNAIDRSCRIEVDLVEAVLELWALSEGTRKIERTPVELAQCLRTAVDATGQEAGARKVDVNVTVPGETLVTMGHRPSLERTLAILLRRAIERSPEKAAVRVRLCAESGWARLDVSDAGPDVDALELPHLFDRYRPIETGATAPQGEINVHLAIARCLATLHQGGLTARREPGGGLTMSLSLPLA